MKTTMRLGKGKNTQRKRRTATKKAKPTKEEVRLQEELSRSRGKLESLMERYKQREEELNEAALEHNELVERYMGVQKSKKRRLR